jgi:hypothetical protein
LSKLIDVSPDVESWLQGLWAFKYRESNKASPFSLIRLSLSESGPSKSGPRNARLCYQAFAFSQLPRRLSSSANGLALLACSSLGRFLIGPPTLYFTKKAFALELLLQDPEGLVDVVIANENFQSGTPLESGEAICQRHRTAKSPARLRMMIRASPYRYAQSTWAFVRSYASSGRQRLGKGPLLGH